MRHCFPGKYVKIVDWVSKLRQKPTFHIIGTSPLISTDIQVIETNERTTATPSFRTAPRAQRTTRSFTSGKGSNITRRVGRLTFRLSGSWQTYLEQPLCLWRHSVQHLWSWPIERFLTLCTRSRGLSCEIGDTSHNTSHWCTKALWPLWGSWVTYYIEILFNIIDQRIFHIFYSKL